jgi:ABC-2 type transport system ATP-binding protein
MLTIQHTLRISGGRLHFAAMDTHENAVDVRELSFQYGQHRALNELCLTIGSRQIFALLGPNGSGKTTLFRILSTLEKFQQGSVTIFGTDLAKQPTAIRRMLGIVFQSASIDRKLTVLENIRCQAALYGLSGKTLQSRIDEVTQQLDLRDRLNDYAETLSGGLKRRVELAKGILHRPKLLLLDEPSTGLDPAARLDLWQVLRQLKETDQVSVVLTTHLLEEADKADCIAIMDTGKVVANGPPAQLRTELGSQVLSVRSSDHAAVVRWLAEQQVSATDHQQQVRVSGEDVAKLIAPLTQQFGSQIQSLTLSQPSLEDVFIAKTGHQFWNESNEKSK